MYSHPGSLPFDIFFMLGFWLLLAPVFNQPKERPNNDSVCPLMPQPIAVIVKIKDSTLLSIYTLAPMCNNKSSDLTSHQSYCEQSYRKPQTIACAVLREILYILLSSAKYGFHNHQPSINTVISAAASRNHLSRGERDNDK